MTRIAGENQMQKKMDTEMETGYGCYTACM